MPRGASCCTQQTGAFASSHRLNLVRLAATRFGAQSDTGTLGTRAAAVQGSEEVPVLTSVMSEGSAVSLCSRDFGSKKRW